MPRRWAIADRIMPRHQVAALSLSVLIVSATLAFLTYAAFFPVPPGGGGVAGGPSSYRWWGCQQYSAAGRSGGDGLPVDHGARAARGGEPTTLSHIVFGIAGTARTWGHRRGYVELWWRPGQTRGHVWLDEEPASPWPAATSPPYRVSAEASRYGRFASASRIARIVADSLLAVTAASNGTAGDDDDQPEVRWFVMGDDDTVFFPDNLVSVLRRYDHTEPYYVGAPSESAEQDALHSYVMAFGGGGFAISRPAAAALAAAMDGCLDRHRGFYGSDERVHACLAELGVPLTREPGFHQLDVRGDALGLLAAHPVAPLVSLHHLDTIQPISPLSRTRVDAVRALVEAARLDPARTVQQSICNHRPGSGGGWPWSVSVAWGYSAQVYPWAVPAHELEVPLQTFKTFRSRANGPFLFNTRPWRPDDACARPMLFFLTRAARNQTDDAAAAATATVTEYSRHVIAGNGKTPEKECGKPDFRSAAAIQTVRVVAPKMSPDDWQRAPRRHCCETTAMAAGSILEVRIRRCGEGELTVATQ